ncbi:MAG TPA: hypothetical protein VMT28_04825 [Terriglobales bacterium]|nr:hypothetical protein [Terriglobales bacterium]
MKKTGLFLLLWLTVAAYAQQTDPMATANSADQAQTPSGTAFTTVSFPTERVQTPTNADIYCAGFISQPMPNANYVAGGLESPYSTKFVNGDIVYLAGSGYQTGQQYAIIRELRDPNQYELFPGQRALLRASGQPYAELARVRIVDTRSKMAIANVEFSCDPVNPGDIAIPYAEKPPIAFHAPLRFDRYAPPNGKASGRILMAKDFDSELGTGAKVYMNIGANQGLKVGDYVRAVRSYSAVLNDPVDSLSFKASTAEDTQKNPPSIEPTMLTTGKGPAIHVADLPRRAVGEIVILSTTPNTATGMIVFSLEDMHVGDGVELDEQQ